MEAETVARRIFRGHPGKRVFAALEESIDSKKNITARKNGNDPKGLKVVELAVYDTVKRALFDSRAEPNVMSADLCTRLHPLTSPTDRKMKMADDTERAVVGEVTIVPVTAGDLT